MSYSRILNYHTAPGIIMLCPVDHLQKVPIGYFLQMERVMGLEPTISAWKANVLPLHYTRILCRNSERLERETGLEPATSALARRRSTK